LKARARKAAWWEHPRHAAGDSKQRPRTVILMAVALRHRLLPGRPGPYRGHGPEGARKARARAWPGLARPGCNRCPPLLVNDSSVRSGPSRLSLGPPDHRSSDGPPEPPTLLQRLTSDPAVAPAPPIDPFPPLDHTPSRAQARGPSRVRSGYDRHAEPPTSRALRPSMPYDRQ
jgi:hypothetical protein